MSSITVTRARACGGGVSWSAAGSGSAAVVRKASAAFSWLSSSLLLLLLLVVAGGGGGGDLDGMLFVLVGLCTAIEGVLCVLLASY